MASDLEKVDAYVNGPADYDEIPELTDEFFARAELKLGGRTIDFFPEQPGATGIEQQFLLSLDATVIDGFRATGPGWQARINDVLRAWLADKVA